MQRDQTLPLSAKGVACETRKTPFLRRVGGACAESAILIETADSARQRKVLLPKAKSGDETSVPRERMGLGTRLTR